MQFDALLHSTYLSTYIYQLQTQGREQEEEKKKV